VHELKELPPDELVRFSKQDFLDQAAAASPADLAGTSGRGDKLKLIQVLVYWVAKMAGWSIADRKNSMGDIQADRILGKARPSVYVERKGSFLRKGSELAMLGAKDDPSSSKPQLDRHDSHHSEPDEVVTQVQEVTDDALGI